MKRFGLILGLVFVFSVVSFAQSGTDYKSRNHKLNKYSKTDKEVVKPVAVNENAGDMHVMDYKNRNAKFHKQTDEGGLTIQKDKIENDYRAFNHKLSKGQNSKFVNRLSDDDDMLTEK
jgi:hypothetical protein